MDVEGGKKERDGTWGNIAFGSWRVGELAEMVKVVKVVGRVDEGG